ncbi:hypothetical protein M011DRAFT_116555 [Sporormia fimetaria CBS 119925]|uniref:Uncharacterized protein n=1 Tax=Sporormia fimetaria CBS 119925 TaxID=1340428 RepID=A0A6A6VNU4_9PLEO|nr:hypothetical protein M011DRAFT_116555 [Sporormia fimetaria CBS 119925]
MSLAIKRLIFRFLHITLPLTSLGPRNNSPDNNHTSHRTANNSTTSPNCAHQPLSSPSNPTPVSVKLTKQPNNPSLSSPEAAAEAVQERNTSTPPNQPLFSHLTRDSRLPYLLLRRGITPVLLVWWRRPVVTLIRRRRAVRLRRVL